jgi:hypothetical protein
MILPFPMHSLHSMSTTPGRKGRHVLPISRAEHSADDSRGGFPCAGPRRGGRVVRGPRGRGVVERGSRLGYETRDGTCTGRTDI